MDIASLRRPKYVINPSRHKVFNSFLAEALAMETPTSTLREMTENVEAQVKPYTKDLVITESAMIKAWSEVLLIYLRKLYTA